MPVGSIDIGKWLSMTSDKFNHFILHGKKDPLFQVIFFAYGDEEA